MDKSHKAIFFRFLKTFLFALLLSGGLGCSLLENRLLNKS